MSDSSSQTSPLSFQKDSENLSGILLQCIHKNPDPSLVDSLNRLNADQWRNLCELAAEHRIAPLFYHKLKSNIDFSPDSRDAIEWLKIYYKQVALNNLRMYEELRKLLRVLNQKDIPLVLLKGIYLDNFVYSTSGLREMNDIDVLAKVSDLQIIYDSLKEIHYDSDVPQDISKVVDSSNHLAPMIRKNGAVFEVHWNLTKPGKYYSIQPDDLWDRVEPVTLSGYNAYSLSTEDLLLHLCIHTSYQHNFSFGLRPFCDITEVADKFQESINWDVLISRAWNYNWHKGTYLALNLSRKLTGATIPDYVFEELKPAEIPPEIPDYALAQVLTEKKLSATVPSSMVDLAGGKGIRHKIQVIFQNIFLPRENMAALYAVPEFSLKIYGYYIIRFFKIGAKYLPSLYRMPLGGRKFGSILQRKKALDQWMSES